MSYFNWMGTSVEKLELEFLQGGITTITVENLDAKYVCK